MKKGSFVVIVLAMFSAFLMPALADARDRFDVIIGPGPYPYYSPYYRPYYDPYYAYPPAPPVVIQPQPPVIIQQQPQMQVQPAPQPQQDYWYFCQNPQGYYPYIKQCPSGWLKVVPPSGPPADATNSMPPAEPNQGLRNGLPAVPPAAAPPIPGAPPQDAPIFR